MGIPRGDVNVAQPRIVIQMLGPFELNRNGAKVPAAAFGSRKARMLLRWLADARDTVVPYHVLLDAVWQDEPEDRAMRSLRVRISELRKLLTPAQTSDELLERVDNGYMLRTVPGQLETDADEFAAVAAEALRTEPPAASLSHLKKSVTLYRGDYFSDDPDTVQWHAARERYRNLFVTVASRLAEIYEAAARYDDGIQLLQDLLARSHADERLYRALIRLQYLNGDQEGALRTFQECRAYLASELAAEPMPETQQLLKQVMRHEPLNDSSSPRLAASARPLERREKAKARSKWPFLGRRAEQATLQRRLALLKEGSGGIVWLYGPAGIGKTRLLRQMLAKVGRERPFRTLWIQGSRLNDHIPFAAILDGLQTGLEPELTPAQKTRLMASSPAPLEQLTGWFSKSPRRKLGPSPSEPDSVSELMLRQQMLLLFDRLIETMPLLLLIDDVSALDEASRGLLIALSRRTGKEPLLIVVASRRSPQQIDVGSELMHIHPVPEIMRLKPLQPSDLHPLMGRGISSPWTQSWLRRLHGETDGKPSLVAAVLHQLRMKKLMDISGSTVVFPRGLFALMTDDVWVDGLPSSMHGGRDDFQRRWEQLDDVERSVVQKAAALKDSFTLERLQQLTDEPPGVVLSVLEHLIRQGFFTVSGSPAGDTTVLSFTQRRLRNKVYRTIPAPERKWHHRRIVRLLQHEQPGGSFVSEAERFHWTAAVARHARLAEQWETAARWSLRAANDAKTVAPGLDVVTLARQALRAALRTTASLQAQLVPMARWALADALYHVGSYREAIPLYETFTEAPDVDQSMIGDRLMTMYLHHNRMEEAEKLAQRLLAEAGDDDGARGLAHLHRAHLHYRSGEPEQAIAAGQEALAHLKAPRYDEKRAKALQQLALVHWDMGDYGQAVAHAREGTTLRRTVSSPELVTSLNQLGELYQDLFCTHLALKSHREALDLALRDGRIKLSLKILRNLGLNFVYEGRMAKGLKILERAWQQVQHFNLGPYWREVHLRSLIEAKILAHEPEEVRRLLRRYEDVTGPRETPFATMLSVGLAFLEGRVNDGTRLLEQVHAFWRKTGRRGRFFHVVVFAGQELMLTGYDERAQLYLTMAMDELQRICRLVPPDVARQIQESRQYVATARLIRGKRLAEEPPPPFP